MVARVVRNGEVASSSLASPTQEFDFFEPIVYNSANV